MIWYSGMHCYSTWLIEVGEDLFFILYSQQYQSRRMMTLHWNTQHQTQWIEEIRDWTLQWFWYSGMHNHPVSLIEVEEELSLSSFTQSIPITENEVAPLKQYLPKSMDRSEVSFVITSALASLNALSPNLTDWSWGSPSHQFTYSVLPIKANESAELKQFSPISTVSSASNSVNLNDVADWNALLLILNDFNDFISTLLFQQFMVTLYYNR